MSSINQQEELRKYIEAVASKLDASKTYSSFTTGTVTASYGSYYKVALTNGSSDNLHTAFSLSGKEFSKDEFVYLIQGAESSEGNKAYYIVGLVDEVEEDFVNLSDLERFVSSGTSLGGDNSLLLGNEVTNETFLQFLKSNGVMKISGNFTAGSATEYGIKITSFNGANELETLYFTTADFRGQPVNLSNSLQEKILIFTKDVDTISKIKLASSETNGSATVSNLKLETGSLIEVEGNFKVTINAINHKDYFTATETTTSLKANVTYNGNGVFTSDMQYYWFIWDEKKDGNYYYQLDEENNEAKYRVIEQIAATPSDDSGRWLCIQDYAPATLASGGTVPIWTNKNQNTINIDDTKFFNQYRNRVKCVLKYQGHTIASNELDIFNYTKEKYSISISANANPAVLINATDTLTLTADAINENQYIAPSTEVRYQWKKKAGDGWQNLTFVQGLANTVWHIGATVTTTAALGQFPSVKYKISNANENWDSIEEKTGIYFGYKQDPSKEDFAVVQEDGSIIDGQGNSLILANKYLKITLCATNQEAALLEILSSAFAATTEDKIGAVGNKLVIQDSGVLVPGRYEMEAKTEIYKCEMEVLRGDIIISQDVSNEIMVESFIDNSSRITVATTYYKYGVDFTSALTFSKAAGSPHVRYIKTKDTVLDNDKMYYKEEENGTYIEVESPKKEEIENYFVEYSYLTDWLAQAYRYVQLTAGTTYNKNIYYYEKINNNYYYKGELKAGTPCSTELAQYYYWDDNNNNALRNVAWTDLTQTDAEGFQYLKNNALVASNGFLFYSQQTVIEEKVVNAVGTIYKTLRVEDWSKPLILVQKINGESITGPAIDKINTFNDLTGSGRSQGLYTAQNGDIYINATYIKTGSLTVADEAGTNVRFKADIDTNDVQIAGFTVDENAIYNQGRTVYLGTDGLRVGDGISSTYDPNTRTWSTFISGSTTFTNDNSGLTLNDIKNRQLFTAYNSNKAKPIAKPNFSSGTDSNGWVSTKSDNITYYWFCQQYATDIKENKWGEITQLSAINPYIVSIENDYMAVSTDENGKINNSETITVNQKAYVKLFLGDDEIDLDHDNNGAAEETIIVRNQNGSELASTNIQLDSSNNRYQITIPSITKDAEIWTVIYKGATASIKVVKLKSGEPGDSGTALELKTSATTVKKIKNINNTYSYSPSSVSCWMLKNGKRDTSYQLYYSLNGGASWTQNSTVDLSEITDNLTSLQFKAQIKGSTTIVDQENVTFLMDGEDGTEGRGIKTVTEWYLASSADSGVTAPTDPEDDGWTQSPSEQTLNATNKYLWNYEVTSYTSGNDTETIPAIVAYYTEDGRGIESIVNKYCVNNISQLPTNDSWKTWEWDNTVGPTSDSAKYLWNYEIVTYKNSDGTKDEVPTTPAIIGTHGEKGTSPYKLDIKNDTKYITTDVDGKGTVKNPSNQNVTDIVVSVDLSAEIRLFNGTAQILDTNELKKITCPSRESVSVPGYTNKQYDIIINEQNLKTETDGSGNVTDAYYIFQVKYLQADSKAWIVSYDNGKATGTIKAIKNKTGATGEQGTSYNLLTNASSIKKVIKIENGIASYSYIPDTLEFWLMKNGSIYDADHLYYEYSFDQNSWSQASENYSSNKASISLTSNQNIEKIYLRIRAGSDKNGTIRDEETINILQDASSIINCYCAISQGQKPTNLTVWEDEETFFSHWKGTVGDAYREAKTDVWHNYASGFVQSGNVITFTVDSNKSEKVDEISACSMAAKYQIKDNIYVTGFSGTNSEGLPIWPTTSEDSESNPIGAITSALNQTNTAGIIGYNTSVPEGDVGRWCQLYNRTVISGGAIVTGSITADKMKVNSLSALSANMGTITAGEIKSEGYTAATTNKLTQGFKLFFNNNDNNLLIDSAYFKVTQDGKITATEGEIAGWNITNDTLSYYNVGLHSGSIYQHDLGGGSKENIRLFAGTRIINAQNQTSTFPFYVTATGRLVATNAEIKGRVTATELYIGDTATTLDAAISGNTDVSQSKEIATSFIVDGDYIKMSSKGLYLTGDKLIIDTTSFKLNSSQNTMELSCTDSYNNTVSIKNGEGLVILDSKGSGLQLTYGGLYRNRELYSATLIEYHYNETKEREEGSFTCPMAHSIERFKASKNLQNNNAFNLDKIIDSSYSIHIVQLEITFKKDQRYPASGTDIAIINSSEYDFIPSYDSREYLIPFYSALSSGGIGAMKIEFVKYLRQTDGGLSLVYRFSPKTTFTATSDTRHTCNFIFLLRR